MLTESNLNEVLNRASKLMSPEGQRQIDNARKYNNNNFDNEGNYVAPAGVSRKTAPANNTQFKSSGLPRAIRESILQNPLNAPANEYNVSGSVLDSIPYEPVQLSKAPVHESTQQVPQMNTQTIDYNYIRSIINECIYNNLQQIKNEILQESQLKAIRIGGENKIQLIDNKNNLFESKLEFKKNISKNK